MRIFIDIDGTLCSEEQKNIAERVPFIERIEQLNDCYDQGAYICIYTSRGMRSTGNAAESDKKYRKLTEEQLAAWGVKYHELLFGKPNADVYIDNKNMLPGNFFDDALWRKISDNIPDDLV